MNPERSPRESGSHGCRTFAALLLLVVLGGLPLAARVVLHLTWGVS
jgi:hypothetical protein